MLFPRGVVIGNVCVEYRGKIVNRNSILAELLKLLY